MKSSARRVFESGGRVLFDWNCLVVGFVEKTPVDIKNSW